MNKAALEYRKLEVATAIESATPHTLVDMLFEGAQQRLSRALGCISHNDIGERSRALNSAIDIINGLQASLDMEQGGDFAENLYALYEYMQRRLFRANADNDAEPVHEVLGLLSTLRGAWLAIAGDERVLEEEKA